MCDLSARYNGERYDLHVDPDKVCAVEDRSGSYWAATKITMAGGGVVEARLRSAEVLKRLDEARRT